MSIEETKPVLIKDIKIMYFSEREKAYIEKLFPNRLDETAKLLREIRTAEMVMWTTYPSSIPIEKKVSKSFEIPLTDGLSAQSLIDQVKDFMDTTNQDVLVNSYSDGNRGDPIVLELYFYEPNPDYENELQKHNANIVRRNKEVGKINQKIDKVNKSLKELTIAVEDLYAKST